MGTLYGDIVASFGWIPFLRSGRLSAFFSGSPAFYGSQTIFVILAVIL